MFVLLMTRSFGTYKKASCYVSVKEKEGHFVQSLSCVHVLLPLTGVAASNKVPGQVSKSQPQRSDGCRREAGAVSTRNVRRHS